jgi:hypothetical protein
MPSDYNSRMNDQHPAPIENATQIIDEATNQDNPLSADLEKAWAVWLKGIKGVDERGMTLLRAAFEVGVEAAGKNAAATLGREGGKKGGRARADKLTPDRRQEIARSAAKARWNKSS